MLTMYKTVKDLFAQEIPPQSIYFRDFFALYGITDTHHLNAMEKAYDMIYSELIKFRLDLSDLESIAKTKPIYEKWGELLLGTYNYTKKVGFSSFDSSNLNYLVQEVGMLYWIMKQPDLFYNFILHDLVEFDGSNYIFWAGLDKVIIKEISDLARKNELHKASTLYNALLKLKNNSFTLVVNRELKYDELKRLYYLYDKEDFS